MTSGNDETTKTGMKPYQKPSLTEYGHVKDLTTGGTGTAKESSSGQKPKP